MLSPSAADNPIRNSRAYELGIDRCGEGLTAREISRSRGGAHQAVLAGGPPGLMTAGSSSAGVTVQSLARRFRDASRGTSPRCAAPRRERDSGSPRWRPLIASWPATRPGAPRLGLRNGHAGFSVTTGAESLAEVGKGRPFGVKILFAPGQTGWQERHQVDRPGPASLGADGRVAPLVRPPAARIRSSPGLDADCRPARGCTRQVPTIRRWVWTVRPFRVSRCFPASKLSAITSETPPSVHC